MLGDRRIRVALFVAVGVGLAFVLWGVLKEATIAPHDVAPKAFHQDSWKNGDSETRIAMAKDLIATGDLLGDTREDLRANLGPISLERQGPTTLCWYLGERQSGAAMMFPYSDYLCLALDHDGRVERAAIQNLDAKVHLKARESER